MKKFILTLICCITPQILIGMEAAQTNIKNTLFLEQLKSKALVAYDEKSQMIYPVCDRINELFLLKDENDQVVVYDNDYHGQISFIQHTHLIIDGPVSKTYEVKSAFKRHDEEIFPIGFIGIVIPHQISRLTGIPEEIDKNRTYEAAYYKHMHCGSVIIAALGLSVFLAHKFS